MISLVLLFVLNAYRTTPPELHKYRGQTVACLVRQLTACSLLLMLQIGFTPDHLTLSLAVVEVYTVRYPFTNYAFHLCSTFSSINLFIVVPSTDAQDSSQVLRAGNPQTTQMGTNGPSAERIIERRSLQALFVIGGKKEKSRQAKLTSWTIAEAGQQTKKTCFR